MHKLEELREEFSLTKRELSKKLNISETTYSKWENNKEIMPTKRIYELAEFYNINIDYLIGFSNNRIKIKTNSILDKNLISKRCLEIRKDYNESLILFVKRLNTSASTWNAYELGKTLILSAFLIEICKKSNYSADWILGRSNIKYR